MWYALRQVPALCLLALSVSVGCTADLSKLRAPGHKDAPSGATFPPSTGAPRGQRLRIPPICAFPGKSSSPTPELQTRSMIDPPPKRLWLMRTAQVARWAGRGEQGATPE